MAALRARTIVVLGGTSDIGLAIARELVDASTRHLVLACRDLNRGEAAAAVARGWSRDAEITVVGFDGDELAAQVQAIESLPDRFGDLDVVVLAYAQLGDNEQALVDPIAAASLAHVDFVAPVASSVAVANILRRQGHGTLVVITSVAGQRVRVANLVYGAAKAGLDAFARSLNDLLAGSGAGVLVVRPGWVRSKMTEGRRPAPFPTDCDAVGRAVADAMRSRRSRTVVWVPGILRFVFAGLRLMPARLWRRISSAETGRAATS